MNKKKEGGPLIFLLRAFRLFMTPISLFTASSVGLGDLPIVLDVTGDNRGRDGSVRRQGNKRKRWLSDPVMQAAAEEDSHGGGGCRRCARINHKSEASRRNPLLHFARPPSFFLCLCVRILKGHVNLAMEVKMIPESAAVGDGMRTVSTNMGTIDVLDSNRSFHCYHGADVMDENNGRPSKKPKIEEQVVEYALPVGFLDPINPDERSLVSVPQTQSILEYRNTDDHNLKAIVPSMSKQFWKAGDYEVSVNNIESVSHPAGMDHVRVHPRFLHSNATSHKWALGAFAELLDNSLDEVRTGATYVNVDVLNNEKDIGSKMLLIEDNGGGMTPDKLRGCMSLGYSVKSKLANTIGQYGNGFKTSTMRLGADVLVFTRCPGQDGRSPTQSIGMLSYTFLMETGKEDIVVPMIDFEKRGDDWGMMVRFTPEDWKRNMETLVQWSPYSTEEALLQQFDFINIQGTRIIIYNIWEDEEGQLELDFDTDPHDIQIRGVNRDPKKIEMAKQYPNSRHFLTYRHSLRNYAAILYLRIPEGFRIILRGVDVIHHNIVDDMMLTQMVTYKPTQPCPEWTTTRNDQNMVAVVTIGFVKDAKDHIDVQGFNVYHKNRLIKPFWRVWNAAGSDGRGVIGVLEADFVEPAHDKQGFERTTVLSRLENRLVVIQKKYWSTNCQEIGYAKRCKNSSDTKCRPSMEDKPDVQSDARAPKLRPIRKVEASTSEESEFPEIITSSSPKIICKESKANMNGDDTIAKLKEENVQLKKRLETSEGVMLNDLLLDLQSEKDKTISLENQIVKLQEKIQVLDQEQINLIDIFSEERNRREALEETLRNKLKEANDTIEELQRTIKVLKSNGVIIC
ncbi:unnamed protein product [Lactuca saligna]|uniref:Morc S5 domain-containing protein n=1 Tax=Lactuca saligna TaxID=75948 RepID=A0AA35UQJ7_LACSI|nr:unnamed protein product [Lactuca saligna]